MTRNVASAMRGMVGVCVAAITCIAVALCLVPAAQAQDQITRTIGGVNYTLPADWEGGSITGDEAVELLGSDDASQVDVYFKEDGLFVSAAFASDEAAELTIEDLEDLTDYALSDETESGLGLMADLGVDIFTDVEQGFPTLTVYTEQMELNHVTYALTGKLFIVNDAQFKGGVFVLLLMPASGQLTEGFLDSFPLLEEPQDIVMADVSMTVPEGCRLIEGSLFGLNFALAGVADDFAGMLAVELPFPTYDGSIGVNDLQQAIDETMDEYGEQIYQIEDVEFWIGSLSFFDFPAVAIDLVLPADDLGIEGYDQYYIGVMGSIMSNGTFLIMFAEPDDYGLAEEIVDSMECIQPDGPVAGSGVADGAPDADDSTDSLPKSDKGFVVTVL